ncbi:hypothetical protein BK700_02120, partial [Bacillus thuringiensis serovar toguchini]
MLLECFYHEKLAHTSYIMGCQDHGVAIVIDPGHTPESISFLVIDTKQHNETNDKPIGIFTGDFLFVGDVGRPDLLETAGGIPHHAKDSAKDLFHSIQKIKTMPVYLQIWPSHRA